jgi:hypothetical protein
LQQLVADLAIGRVSILYTASAMCSSLLCQNGSVGRMKAPFFNHWWGPVIAVLVACPVAAEVDSMGRLEPRDMVAPAAFELGSQGRGTAGEVRPPMLAANATPDGTLALGRVASDSLAPAGRSGGSHDPQGNLQATSVSAFVAIPENPPSANARGLEAGGWAASFQSYLRNGWQKAAFIGGVITLAGFLFWRLGLRARPQAEQEREALSGTHYEPLSTFRYPTLRDAVEAMKKETSRA